MSLLELLCHVDDFCQSFLPRCQAHLLAVGMQQRQRAQSLSESEIMTILIVFHQSRYRDFNAFYRQQVLTHRSPEFPGLVSYTRFVEFMPSVLLPLYAYLRHCMRTCTGISFLDSTDLTVCHHKRISQHKVFAGTAARGKTSIGWFFGFKLHLLFNDRSESVKVALTVGNVNDRKPVPAMGKRLFGKIFADRVHLSKALFQELLDIFSIQLISKLKKNMKNQFMPLVDKILLRTRAIAETIIDQLKNISQIEHSRHRSPVNFVINVVCGRIASGHQPKKPSLHVGELPALMA